MITSELENCLNKLEANLDDFSIEKLRVDDAISLKQSFRIFKNQLHSKLFMNSKNVKDQKSNVSINSAQKKILKINCLISNLLQKIQYLKKDNTADEERGALETIELAALIVLQLTLDKNT